MTKVSLGFYILICFYSHHRPSPFYFIKIKQNLHPLKVFKGTFFFFFFPRGKTFVGALNRDESKYLCPNKFPLTRPHSVPLREKKNTKNSIIFNIAV